jgi:hypothetical protein
VKEKETNLQKKKKKKKEKEKEKRRTLTNENKPLSSRFYSGCQTYLNLTSIDKRFFGRISPLADKHSETDSSSSSSRRETVHILSLT